MILAINAAFGLLGIGVAHLASWQPWKEDWRNGISFAMLGLALVRVRVPGVDVDPPDSSVHALHTIMRWTIGWLDDFADNSILKQLRMLESAEMRELVAFILTNQVIPDSSMDSQDRAAEVNRMAAADGRLQEGDRAAWSEMLAWCVLQTRRRLLVIDRVRP